VPAWLRLEASTFFNPEHFERGSESTQKKLDVFLRLNPNA
jgi:hypothetical protein